MAWTALRRCSMRSGKGTRGERVVPPLVCLRDALGTMATV